MFRGEIEISFFRRWVDLQSGEWVFEVFLFVGRSREGLYEVGKGEVVKGLYGVEIFIYWGVAGGFLVSM